MRTILGLVTLVSAAATLRERTLNARDLRGDIRPMRRPPARSRR
jgi:hypothetical protein